MYKKIIRNNKEVDIIGYDRDVETTFNTYSVEEIRQYKTLMRHVGGCVMVAYELFKKDNGYKETSVRAVKDKDGNTIYLPIKEVFFSKEYGGALRGSYMQMVNKALNYNHKQRKKDASKTQPVVVIINKLAGMREREKNRANLKVNSFIINRKLPIERDFNDKDIAGIKKTLNSITSNGK